MADELRCEKREDTLVLTLDRPAKRNALSASMVASLHEYVDRASSDGTHLLVLRGAGANFSAGFDFDGYRTQSEGDLLIRFVRIEQLLAAIFHAPFDTLALAHGRNFGAGVDLMAACARRVASPQATFRLPGLSFGLALGIRRLASRLGDGPARQVLGDGLTVDARRARDMGLLTEVVPDSDWEDHINRMTDTSTRLELRDRTLLHGILNPDTCDSDLADVVRSAAAPEFKQRLSRYREEARPS